ncbi:AMP-binding protein [Mycobacterium sp. MMS18-G62]
MVSSASVVAHAEPDANVVVQRYLAAFSEDSSILVAAGPRLACLRSADWLADWCTTDCASTFEPGRCATDELVIESSGTTGEPKLIRYRKQTLRECATAIAKSLPLTAQREAYVSLVNPRLAYGLSIMHSHLSAGVPVTMKRAPISLDSWEQFRHELRPNSSVYLLPHQSYMLAHKGFSFDNPIELIFAGGRLTRNMVDHLYTSFPNATIVNMYGQAEMGPRIAIGRYPISDFREGNVGVPLPGVKIRIAQENSIEVQTPYQMASYIAGDGTVRPMPAWWPTGDIGHLSPTGDLYVDGRAAADINFLGTRVRLADLGDVVRGVDGVLDVGVSAADHTVYGQQPSIRVLTQGGGDIEARARKALAALIGTRAAAVLIRIVEPANLPESGKI